MILAAMAQGWGAQRSALQVEVVAAAGPVWVRRTIDDTSRGADGVKVGDLNGDGLPDLVTGWEEGGEVRVYLNPGAGKVKVAWPRVTVGKVGDPEDAVFADLDEDGLTDVLSFTEGKTRTVYWHRYSGEKRDMLDPARWRTDAIPATQGSQAWMQGVAEVVQTRRGLELFLGSKESGATVGWLQRATVGRTDPNGWSYRALRGAGWIMSMIAHDMEGDGDMDVVFTDRRGGRAGAFWLANPGESSSAVAEWGEHPIGAQGREAMFGDLADMDGDGLMDMVVAVKPDEIAVCLQRPGLRWAERRIRVISANLGNAKAVKAVDLSGDGIGDLVYTCEGAVGAKEGIVWLEQQTGGPWKQRRLGGPDGTKFDLVQALDVDGDGDMDLITCEETDQLGVIWYENPGG